MGLSSRSMTRQIEGHLGRRLPADWEEEFKPLRRCARRRTHARRGHRRRPRRARASPHLCGIQRSHDKMRLTLGMTGSPPTLRRPHLQRHRGRARQGGPRSVPSRRAEDGGRARGVRRGRGQSVRSSGSPGRGHAGLRLRRRTDSRGPTRRPLAPSSSTTCAACPASSRITDRRLIAPRHQPPSPQSQVYKEPSPDWGTTVVRFVPSASVRATAAHIVAQAIFPSRIEGMAVTPSEAMVPPAAGACLR